MSDMQRIERGASGGRVCERAARGLPRSVCSWVAAVAWSCGDPVDPPPQGTEGSSTTSAGSVGSGPESTSSSTLPTTLSTTVEPETTTTEPATSSTGSSTATAVDDTTAGSSSSAEDSTTGTVACTKNVVLMGYWPPTNEMLRPWSQNPEQNPGGWIGEDWEGYGYDVYSFFPEFPPDGDPSNDPIGSDGSVGSARFDLRVDYQATSEDFWSIVDTLEPVIVMTNSRGGDIGWEVEAIEGGHGVNNMNGPEFDWSSDQHGADTRPTQATIDARSWDAISTYRQGTTLPTRLPVEDIVAATTALGLTNVEIDETGTSGNYLSGFLGLHGLYYAETAAHEVVAAGHIHVGYGLPVADASVLIETSLHAVLQAHPADRVPCP
jgi:hypothetical protein